MYKIAVIYSNYPEMEVIAKEYKQKKEYQIEILNGVLDRGIELAREYESKGFDLIISRGATGVLISRFVNIPVINVEITNFDIFKTLYKAKEYGEKIAFFQYSGSNRILKRHDYEFIRNVLGIEKDNLQIYSFKDEDELKEKMAEVYNKSVDVVVGIGTYIMEIAKQYGIKTLMVHSTKEAIYNAFDQAENLIKVKREYYIINNYLKAMVNESFAGLIILDTEDNIRYVSQNTYELLDIDQNLLYKNAFRVFKNISIFSKLMENEDKYVVNYKGKKLKIDKITLKSSKGTIGKAIRIEDSNDKDILPKKEDVKVRNLGMKARYTFRDMVGNSDVMKSLKEKAKVYSKTDGTILITGESGTGKEVLANSIHNESARKDGPFVAVNCATLPKTLLESELFGYEEGAFTGAKRGGKAGLFELANGGTIFLDEISEITPSAQAQLLRVLEERTIMRVGGNKLIPIDVRVIAATNADLSEKIQSGEFRMDLFYRLNVLNLRIPALRERKEDIPLLVKHFIKNQTNKDIQIPEIFKEKLMNHHWSGNVRELKNFVDKFIILSQHYEGQLAVFDELLYDLGSEININKMEYNDDIITVEIDTLKGMELQIIEELAYRYGDNKTKLAEKLGISRTSLWNKLKEIEKIKR